MTDSNARLVDARHFTRGLRAEENAARARSRRLDIGIELAIVVLTTSALWLITSDVPQRWGFVIGLASQPFYIAGTWRARRWGMLFVAVMMCGLWLRGIANHFF